MTGRKAFIHVGMPKTGTTAIQEALSNHVSELRSEGISAPFTERLNHPALIQLFHPLAEKHWYFKESGVSEERARQCAKLLWNAVDRSDCDLVLSSEYLFSAGSEFGRMADQFRSAGFVPTIVFYLRHPVDAAISAAQQSVKMGHTSLQQAVKDVYWHNPLPSLRAARECGCEVVVRNFGNVGDVVSDFFRVIGSRIKITANRSNESLTMDGAILADLHHRYTKKHGHTPFAKDTIFEFEGGKFTLPKPALDKVRRESETHVSDIANEFNVYLIERGNDDRFSWRLSDSGLMKLVESLMSPETLRR